LTLLGAAIAFATADQASRVGADLESVQTLEEALTDTALIRANLAIAVAATTSGDRQTVEEAVSAARDLLGELGEGTAVTTQLTADRQILGRSIDEIGAALEADDPAAATALAVESAGPALNRIAAEFEGASAELQSAIEAEHAEAGRAARLSSFSAALLAPALVIWSFRRATRRRLERQRLEGELRRSADLSRAKDELIAGLSHQLRTPLTGIQGFSLALLDQAEEGDLDRNLVAEIMETVYRESQELARMIDDFLVVSRSDAGALSFVLRPARVEAAARNVVEVFRRAGRSLEVDLDDRPVSIDESRFRHLLRNLIDNAFTHGRPPVILRGRETGAGYLLQVIDHGSGIPEADLEGAFAGFVHSGKAATVTGSLGLGLLAARTLAEGMGCRLGYQRRPGSSAFELELPLAANLEPVRVV
jgi:signal transduction histidine kinase